jgi:hypothetical protein
MAKDSIIRGILISVLIISYFVITIRYLLVFRKSVIFTGNVRVLHVVLIWLIPFIWILILKSLTKSTPGSFEVETKEEPIPFSDNNDDANKAAHM